MSEILLNKWLEAGVQTSLSILAIRKFILVWPTCRTPAVGKVCVSECVSWGVIDLPLSEEELALPVAE